MNTDFTSNVRTVVSRIPKSRVATYGQVAKLAGRPGAARAVGAIMRTNKDIAAVPCHRVVGSTGLLTGYAYGSGIGTKKKKLIEEGVSFIGDKINLKVSQWDSK